MAQHHHFDILGRLPTTANHDEREDHPQDRIERRKTPDDHAEPSTHARAEVLEPHRPKRIAAVGDASKSLYLSFGFATPDSSNAKYRQYNTEMEASGSKADRDELSRSAWNATHVTADLLKTLKTVDSASLIQAAKSAGAQDFGGGVAPWNWSTPVDLLPGARTFGSSVFFAKVGNGTLTPLADGKAFDILEPGTVPNLGS